MMFFRRDDEKAPEGWRSPKPGGVLKGLWPSRQRLGGAPSRFCAAAKLASVERDRENFFALPWTPARRRNGPMTSPQFPRTLVLCAAMVLAITPAFGQLAAQTNPADLPAPKRARVPQLDGPVRIDGKLDEAVWQSATVLKPFLLNDDGAPSSEPTEVRVWYDNQALYLGWICTDADIEATLKERDSRFWEEEVVEFFATPHPEDLGHYFELQWNPLGGMFDATIDNHLDDQGLSTKFEGDWSFTAKAMTAAVSVDGTVGNPHDRDTRWVVEVKLPFSDLNQAMPKPGTVWRANFYRYDRAQGKQAELVSWSPTRLPGFHQPARFGYLEFQGTGKADDAR